MINFYRKVRKTIAEHGHQVLGVGADYAAGVPGFTYTIGLSERCQPELVVFGLPPEYAAGFLNKIAEDGIQFDQPYAELANMPLWLKRCSRELAIKYCVQAERYYERPLEYAQLVLPDRAGLFPWDEGYDAAYMTPRQPLLFSN